MKPIVLQFLKEKEAKKACDTILSLREHWDQQHPLLPTYTLGASIGNIHDEGPYLESCQRINPILQEHFSWLYDKIVDCFHTYDGKNYTFTEEFSYPGFVIYMAPAFSKASKKSPVQPPIHRDHQFRDLKWRDYYDEIDFDASFSSTGALSLPTAGSGLNWWDYPLKEKGDYPPSELVLKTPMKYLEYKEGYLCRLSCDILHQAALSEFAPGDMRITMQLHAVFADGAYRLYF